MTQEELDQLRAAVADYMFSEGCSCCRDDDAHKINRQRLGDLLLVGAKDGYYDFSVYRTASLKPQEVTP